MFFTVSGGAYGLEDVVGSSGAGMAILLIVLTPLFWSLPTALMVAELATAMPVEGGFYFWVKRALGPFWGFQEGWWSWLTHVGRHGDLPGALRRLLGRPIFKIFQTTGSRGGCWAPP